MSTGKYIGYGAAEAECEKLDYLLTRTKINISPSSLAWLNSIYKWDIYYLRMAKLVASKSKDPSTQTGAVIVRPDNSLCSIGFNGFPKVMPDNPDNYSNREEKYSRIVHCEVNAQLFSRDASLQDYTLYTWPFASCDRCCVQMLQVGITRFVAPVLPEHLKERWEASLNKTKGYIEECNRILDLIDVEGVL
jgi:dCMP deaminase